jgi:hypothetical protein
MGEGIVGTLCLGVLLVGAVILLLIVVLLLSRRREPPAGTYDSERVDSGVSIGGMRGGRAYDSEEFDSGATFGGDRERRAYDSERVDSGASIGGGPSAGKKPGRTRAPIRSRSVRDSWETSEVGKETPREKPRRKPYRTRKTGKRVDSPDIESGGSFGG